MDADVVDSIGAARREKVRVGRDMAILGLDEHLSTAAPVDGESLVESPERKAFMPASSDDWWRASMAPGTGEAQPRAAAARAAAAYTGES